MNKKLLNIFIMLLLSSAASAQNVSAYQAGAYQPGIMNVRDLATAGPGFVFIDYNYWNKSSSYYDRFGSKVGHIEFDYNNKQAELDLSAQVSGYINVPVFFYATNLKILNARYSVSISPVIVSSNYKMNIHASVADSTVISTGNSGGFSDMAIMPVGLGWSFETIDFSFFYAVYVPTGRYETGAADNLGKGYWTHQFQGAFYKYFKEKSTALFVMPTFEVNSKIKDADARPGSRLTVEYGISQYVNSWLEFEILNGHNWQVSDDKGDDIWWANTPLYTKDHTSTVSFGVGVWPIAGKLNIRAKYAMDYAVKQRYKSNFLSLSLVYIPGF